MIGTCCPICKKFAPRCSRPLPPGTIVNGEEATCIVYYRCKENHLMFCIEGPNHIVIVRAEP